MTLFLVRQISLKVRTCVRPLVRRAKRRQSWTQRTDTILWSWRRVKVESSQSFCVNLVITDAWDPAKGWSVAVMLTDIGLIKSHKILPMWSDAWAIVFFGRMIWKVCLTWHADIYLPAQGVVYILIKRNSDLLRMRSNLLGSNWQSKWFGHFRHLLTPKVKFDWTEALAKEFCDENSWWC